MKHLNRRELVGGIAGAVVLTAAIRVQPTLAGGISANSGDSLRVHGAGADLDSLRDQLLAFFGSQSQAMLQSNIISEYDTRITSNRALVFDQFSAVFGSGPAEVDEMLENGMRMVVRFLAHNARYKAIVFLGADDAIAAAAMTYFRSPPGGLIQSFAGKPTHFACENNLSVQIFFKQSVNAEVFDAVRAFLKEAYPFPGDQLTAEMLGQKGLKMKIMATRV